MTESIAQSLCDSWASYAFFDAL